MAKESWYRLPGEEQTWNWNTDMMNKFLNDVLTGVVSSQAKGCNSSLAGAAAAAFAGPLPQRFLLVFLRGNADLAGLRPRIRVVLEVPAFSAKEQVACLWIG